MRLEKPVEERPPVVFIRGDVPGELRHWRAPRLPGEEHNPVALLLAAVTHCRCVAARTLEEDEKENSKAEPVALARGRPGKRTPSHCLHCLGHSEEEEKASERN